MTSRGAAYLRSTANQVLDAFVRAVEQAHGDDKVSTLELEQVAAKLKDSPAFNDFFIRHFNELFRIVSDDILEQQRTNAFGRLMVHPLNAAFDSGLLERDVTPNFLSFLHLVLGDEVEHRSNHCFEICADLKARLGEDFTWDVFYADSRAKGVFWRVLERIALSFARFDARKEWFKTLMQNRPTAHSLASNAFLPHGHHAPDEVHPFTERHFHALFSALFEPVHHLSAGDLDLFVKSMGKTPDEAYGPFLKHLGAMALSAG